jgi:serine protease AprX
MFGSGRVRRFTQDSPVLPDVWLDYAGVAGDEADLLQVRAPQFPFPPVKLLLTPFRENAAGDVRTALVERLEKMKSRGDIAGLFGRSGHSPRVAYNVTTVAATLHFEELVRVVLPMTDWWAQHCDEIGIGTQTSAALEKALIAGVRDPEHAPPLKAPPRTKAKRLKTSRGGAPQTLRLPPELLWTIRVAGALAIAQKNLPLPAAIQENIAKATEDDWAPIVRAFLALVRDPDMVAKDKRVYSVSRNRVAAASIARSMLAIKADAARRLFDITAGHLAWAVIDSGIDAEHPAFRQRVKHKPVANAFRDGRTQENFTRVVETYDFTQIDLLLDPSTPEQPTCLRERLAQAPDAEGLQAKIRDLQTALMNGRTLDWKIIAPLLRIPHREREYVPPKMDHGTHVAGILAGDWKRDDPDTAIEQDLVGVCPDLRLYDLRVLDGNGLGDEFGVMAALQFVRYLNSTNDYVVVHGVNLSLSLQHDVSNYACGRTPVCEEAERVAAAGIVVVAAAGNQGYRKYTTAEGGTGEAYNFISITDPGNADSVITVGATHRFRPHTYGVSYFSSRGPTGDGRRKPDLVAPGEKITSPLPSRSYGLKDGTSMAAPHVSGAAALLMARHSELIGQTARIKQILCDTSTDLGRERYFQGAGMLDVLRALQSV